MRFHVVGIQYFPVFHLTHIYITRVAFWLIHNFFSFTSKCTLLKVIFLQICQTFQKSSHHFFLPILMFLVKIKLNAYLKNKGHVILQGKEKLLWVLVSFFPQNTPAFIYMSGLPLLFFKVDKPKKILACCFCSLFFCSLLPSFMLAFILLFTVLPSLPGFKKQLS